MLGEPAAGVARVDQVAVHRHVEDAAGARDQLGFDVEAFLDFARQTGGLRVEVSRFAVGYGDPHAGKVWRGPVPRKAIRSAVR